MTSSFLFLRALVKQGKECLCMGKARRGKLHGYQRNELPRHFVKISTEQVSTSFLSTNTHCTAFASPLLGAERSSDIFPSHFPLHFPLLVLHQPRPSHFYLTFFPHPLRITQQALICQLPTKYTLSTYFICVFTRGSLKNSLLKQQLFISKKPSCKHFRRKKVSARCNGKWSKLHKVKQKEMVSVMPIKIILCTYDNLHSEK